MVEGPCPYLQALNPFYMKRTVTTVTYINSRKSELTRSTVVTVALVVLDRFPYQRSICRRFGRYSIV